MNKQEAIEKIKNADTLTIIVHPERDQEVEMVNKNEVLDIISQIHEPEKVVVPKFVAKYIEESKYDKFYALHGAYANMDEEMKCWRLKGNNSELFARAWLAYPNITVEPEKLKLYTVEIPNPNLNAHVVLQKTGDGLVLVTVGNAGWAEWESSKLTEAEIKKDFDFLWKFAKHVEDK